MKIILASGSNGRKTLLESLKIPFEVVESKIDEEKIWDKDPVKLATTRAIAKTEAVAKKLRMDSHGLGLNDFHGTDITDKNQSVESVPRKSNSLIGENPGDERIEKDGILIIGADTVGFMGNPPGGEANWVFGKPKNRKEAEEILTRLSGKTHKYVSAHCIINFQIQSSKFQDPKIPRNQRLGSSTVQQFNRSCGYDISSVTFRKLTAKDISTYLDRVEYRKLCGGIKINDSPQDFVVSINGSISTIIGLSLEKLLPILRQSKLL